MGVIQIKLPLRDPIVSFSGASTARPSDYGIKATLSRVLEEVAELREKIAL
jgi:hypothetical protein